MNAIPAGACPANPTPAQLSAAREALVARIDAAADRAMRLSLDMPGMPSGLSAAICYLAAHGVVASACRGEIFFNWDTATSRHYLKGLDDASRAAELADGEKMLFTGRRAICGGVLEAARDLGEAADEMAQARAESTKAADERRTRWNANSAAYFARKDRRNVPQQVAA